MIQHHACAVACSHSCDACYSYIVTYFFWHFEVAVFRRLTVRVCVGHGRSMEQPCKRTPIPRKGLKTQIEPRDIKWFVTYSDIGVEVVLWETDDGIKRQPWILFGCYLCDKRRSHLIGSRIHVCTLTTHMEPIRNRKARDHVTHTHVA